MRYYAEFGGGLGDVFQQMFIQGLYAGLLHLGADDSAEVAIISHNPHVKELFEWHPKRSRMSVRNLGYWLGEQDAEMRRRHYLPPYSAAKPMVLRDMTTAPVFYPSLEDLEVLRSELGTDHHRAVVFSPCAGLPDRDIPAPIVEKLALMTVEAGFVPVFVGRTYDRFERGERWRSGVPDGCVNLIDRLSVPGVAALAQATLGSVCCHSAVSMLGWYLRKPQLLLYPQSVVERHFTNRDQWSFGLSFQECFHECFEEATWEVQADAFLDFLTQRSATTKKETAH